MMQAITKLAFVNNAPAEVDYTDLHLIADQWHNQVAINYVQQMRRLERAFPKTRIIELLSLGHPPISILDEIPFTVIEGQLGFAPKLNVPNRTPSVSLKKWIRDVLIELVTLAGIRSRENLIDVVHSLPELSRRDIQPDAVAWATQHAGETITDISSKTRRSIRATIVTGFMQNRTPQQIATDVERIIGLYPGQATQLLKFGEVLQSQGVPLREVSRRLAKFKDSLLKRRAISIARTEVMAATNGGQQISWEMGLRNGVIDEDRARKRVIITPDDRLDTKICAPMPTMPENLDVRIGESFTLPGGRKKSQAPFHTRCRCTSGLVFLT